jgi:hypothetical protein
MRQATRTASDMSDQRMLTRRAPPFGICYFILEGSLMVSPSTANTPLP